MTDITINDLLGGVLEPERDRMRKDFIEELRQEYILGDITVDPDDPRTTVGLTEWEVAYITGQTITGEGDEPRI